MEIELKLLVTQNGAQALRQHALLKKYATAKSHQHVISDVYFDTPDLLFRRNDAGLRVRRVDGGWLQTMKAGGKVEGGLHSRHEWESPLGSPAPDLAALRAMVGHQSVWAKLLRTPGLADLLVPIFTTRVKRRVWDCRLPQGDEVECVLDLGTIECSGQSVPISEIELEIHSGEPAHLFDFALALLPDIPLQIAVRSKADRGYALFAQSTMVAVHAANILLSKKMTVEAAFEAIAANCIVHIQTNGACLAEEDDAEAVHQMRVGLRRLRCALRVFRDVLPVPDVFLTEFAWLGGLLAAARDWHVLSGSTIPAIAAAVPDERRLQQVALDASETTREKRHAATAAILSPRYASLMLHFTRWMCSCGWRDAMPPNDRRRLTEPVTRFSCKALTHLQHRLRRQGCNLHDANTKKHHQVRIAAKNLRYVAEFFQSLDAVKNRQLPIKTLARLQDVLGTYNDGAVAVILLDELQHRQTSIEAGVSFAQGYLAARRENDHKSIRRLWKKLFV